MKKKRSAYLLISAIFGIIYSIYLVSYFFNISTNQSDTAAVIGAGIATALVTPHMICTVLAAIFNTIAWASNHRAFALTGAILYCVAAVTFLMYAPFVLVQIILSFIGFARLKKLKQLT